MFWIAGEDSRGRFAAWGPNRERRIDATDLFGHGVTIDDDALVVRTGPRSPADYLFGHDGSSWVQTQVFSPIDGGRFYSAAFLEEDLLAGGQGRAHILSAADFELAVHPESVASGETLYLRSCKAMAGSPALLFVVDVSGISVFQRILFGFYDANGQLDVSSPIPTGLAGLTIDLQAFGRGTDGTVQATDPTRLEFE